MHISIVYKSYRGKRRSEGSVSSRWSEPVSIVGRRDHQEISNMSLRLGNAGLRDGSVMRRTLTMWVLPCYTCSLKIHECSALTPAFGRHTYGNRCEWCIMPYGNLHSSDKPSDSLTS